MTMTKETIDVIEFVGIFVLTSILDMVWAGYISAVADKKVLMASILSAIIVLFGGISILAYINKPILLIASVLGAFCGTYFMVKRAKKNEFAGNKTASAV